MTLKNQGIDKKRIVLTIILSIFILALSIQAFKFPVMKQVIAMGLMDGSEIEPEIVDVEQTIAFPAPGGPYQVGRTILVMQDYSRYNIFSADHSEQDAFEYVVKVYYPSEDKNKPASDYVSAAFNQEIANFMVNKQGNSPLQYFQQNAVDQLTPAHIEGGFPVLIFAPGGGFLTELYSYIFETLASHGYVVFAVTDPVSSPLVEYPHGKVKVAPSIKEMGDFMIQGSTGNQAANQIVDYYFNKASTLEMLHVLHSIDAINEDHALLNNTMDTSRVGTFGHSLGGASAVQTALYDSRVDAVLIYDSYLFHVLDPKAEALNIPSLFMATEGIELDEEGAFVVTAYNEENRAYLNTSGQTEYITLAGTSHASFLVDLLITISQDEAEKEELVQGVDKDALVEQIVRKTVDFFDKTLGE